MNTVNIETIKLKDNDDNRISSNKDRNQSFIDINTSIVTDTRKSLAVIDDHLYENGYKYELLYQTKIFDKTTKQGHFIILTSSSISIIIVNIVALIIDHRTSQNNFFDYLLIVLIILTVTINLYYVNILNINFEFPFNKRIKLFSLVFSIVLFCLYPWSHVLDNDESTFSFFTYIILFTDIFFVSFVTYGITIESINIKELIDTILADTRSKIIIDEKTKKVKCYSFQRVMLDERIIL